MVLLISTQGFGELESCGGVELSQCDAIKENRYQGYVNVRLIVRAVGVMVFAYIIRSRPRRRASHPLAEG